MTPKLRFPEFNSQWQAKYIGDLLKIGSGRDYRHLEAGNIPVYGTGGLMFHVNDYLYDGKSIGIGRKGTIDRPQFLTGKFWTVDTLFYTHGYEEVVPEFMYLIFQRVNWRKWNEASGVPSLSKSTIEKIRVIVPNEAEQEKIADFFTVVDGKITKTDKKVQLLREYKKSIMQKIFTQQVHFKDKDGNHYPQWEEKYLSEVATRVNTRNNDEAIKNVLTNSAVKGIVNQNDFFDKDIANQNNLANYHIVSTDDFVYNPRISANAPVGPIKRNHLNLGVMSPLYSIFRFKDVSLDFYENYFETKYWHEYMRSVANSGARHDRMNITNSDLYELPLPFPSIEEQYKIAQFLTMINTKIKSEEAKLAGAIAFKRGLLQRMFV